MSMIIPKERNPLGANSKKDCAWTFYVSIILHTTPNGEIVCVSSCSFRQMKMLATFYRCLLILLIGLTCLHQPGAWAKSRCTIKIGKKGR